MLHLGTKASNLTARVKNSKVNCLVSIRLPMNVCGLSKWTKVFFVKQSLTSPTNRFCSFLQGQGTCNPNVH